MSNNKTKETDESYFSTITDEARRGDCEVLAKLMTRATKQPPKMWGTSIVGFGSHHYRYESGREGDSCLVSFSSRKGDISIYGLGSRMVREELAAQLGKYKAGKGCLYVRKLSDIDLTVLERVIVSAAAEEKRLCE